MRRKKDGKAGFETPIVDPRIAMSRSDLKLKLQNQISIFTTIKTYLEKKDTILFLVSMYLLLEIGLPSLYKVI